MAKTVAQLKEEYKNNRKTVAQLREEYYSSKKNPTAKSQKNIKRKYYKYNIKFY